MIRNHPQSGCGCNSFAIFTDAISGETHGFCGDDDSCDGMWGSYFYCYVLETLDPSEYAQILSSIPSSQVAHFRHHISAHELILQHPQSGCGCDLTCTTLPERCMASVEMMTRVTAFGNISVGRV